MAMDAYLHMKLRSELRTRADACATLTGATLNEFVREAIRDKCESVERLHGQRERAHKAALAKAELIDERNGQ